MRRRSSLAAILAAFDPDVVQLSGDEPVEVARPSPRRTWKVLHLPAGRARERPGRRRRRSCRAAGPGSPAASSASCSTPPAGRTRAGPGRARPNAWPPRSPARCRSSWPAASIRPTSPAPCRDVPAVGVDVASGVERPRPSRRAPGEGPVARRALRQAGARRPRRPAEPPVRADARPRRPARRRRCRPVGDGARLRRPLRPRDADGRARAARDGVRRRSATTRSSGRSCASCCGRSPVARRRSTGPTAWPTPSGPRRPGSAATGRAAAPASRAFGSTSSARTSPTPAPTRSTTRSARRS